MNGEGKKELMIQRISHFLSNMVGTVLGIPVGIGQ